MTIRLVSFRLWEWHSMDLTMLGSTYTTHPIDRLFTQTDQSLEYTTQKPMLMPLINLIQTTLNS